MHSENGKRKTENGKRSVLGMRSAETAILENSQTDRRHSEGAFSDPNNPLPFRRVETLKFTKKRILQIPFSVFRTLFSS